MYVHVCMVYVYIMPLILLRMDYLGTKTAFGSTSVRTESMVKKDALNMPGKVMCRSVHVDCMFVHTYISKYVCT